MQGRIGDLDDVSGVQVSLYHVAGGAGAVVGVAMLAFRTMLLEAAAEVGRRVVEKYVKLHKRFKRRN